MKRRDFLKKAAAEAGVAAGIVSAAMKSATATPAGTLAGEESTARPEFAGGKTNKLRGEWPLPGQNNRYLANAELPCPMPNAPKVLWSHALGRVPVYAAMCADVDDDGEMEVLTGTFPLVCTSLAGKEKWRSDAGAIFAITDVDGDGHTELLVGGVGEHEPLLIRGSDGKALWRRSGPGEVGGCIGRFHTAKLLPGVKGLQVAVVTEEFGKDSKIAQVWTFADGCEHGKLAWERQFANWEHSALTVGLLFGRPCLVSPTWGGMIVMDAKDGSDLMRLYWEEAPGKSGLRNYGPTVIADLDGDGQPELVQLSHAISQHIDVFAPHRGGYPLAGGGAHSVPKNPWPAPHAELGELCSYEDGPILWHRYFGVTWPQDPFLIRIPDQAIADVDGDGKKEIVAFVGREQWELKVYDEITGAEKLSLPDVSPAASVLDFDGDGYAEIAVNHKGALVIGAVRDGKWTERIRLEGGRLWTSAYPVAPSRPGEPHRLDQLPITIGKGAGRAFVCTRAGGKGGGADLVLLTAKPGGGFLQPNIRWPICTRCSFSPPRTIA